MDKTPIVLRFWEIPQNTPASIVCVVCKTPLSGGLDTYGPIRFERCQTHFLNDSYPDEAKDYYLDLYQTGNNWIMAEGPLRVWSLKTMDRMKEKLYPLGEEIKKLAEAYPSLGVEYGIPDWAYGKITDLTDER